MLSPQTTPERSPQSVAQIRVGNNLDVSSTATKSAAVNNYPKVTMATIQIPQMRVLQAVSSKPAQTQHFQHQLQTPQQHSLNQQLHQIQILKAIPSSRAEILIPSTLSTVPSSKSPSPSPSKGPSTATIPRTKVPQGVKGSSKLKVGDTIVIPAKALNSFNPPGSIGAQSIVIKNEQGASTPGHLVFSTPTKFLPTIAKSPVLAKPAASQQSSQTCGTASQPPSSLLSNSLSSPSRLCTLSPPSWTPSPMRYKRPNEYTGEQDCFHDSIKKSRRALSAHEKGSKGLRHFAMLVCEKVKQKITTTYNEVADELVSEYSNSQRHFNDQQYDQKNIRRRVYDALNVLMAMNIIYKDKKDIHWVGLPTNSAQELQSLQLEKQKREQKIKQKTAQLHELILQQIAFKNLVQRNKQLQHVQGPPASNSAIQLPFIIVNTSKKTVIDCSISNDKYEYLFNFDNTFEIHDDIEVLKRMGMAYGLEKGTCSKENLRMAQSLVPPVLRTYLEEMACHKCTEDSSSSYQTVNAAHDSQSTTGDEQLTNSAFDGHQLLSSLKPDPDDHEVEMMINKNEENRSSFACVSAPGASSLASSSTVDALNVFQSVQNPQAGFDLNYLPPATLSFPSFDN